jgi:hypothetical protein
VDRLIRSEVDREIDHDSDHLPIVTELDMSITQLKREIGRDWKALDEKVFDDMLRLESPPLLRPRTKAALDRYVREIVTAIKKAAEEATRYDDHQSNLGQAGTKNAPKSSRKRSGSNVYTAVVTQKSPGRPTV